MKIVRISVLFLVFLQLLTVTVAQEYPEIEAVEDNDAAETTTTLSTSTSETPSTSSPTSASSTNATSTTTPSTTTVPCANCQDIGSIPVITTLTSTSPGSIESFRPTSMDFYGLFILISPGNNLFVDNNAELVVYSGYGDNPNPWRILGIYNATTIKDASRMITTNNPGEIFSIKFTPGKKDGFMFRDVNEIQYSVVAVNTSIFNNPGTNITGTYDINIMVDTQPFLNASYGYPEYYFPNTNETFRYIPQDPTIYVLFYLLDYGKTFDSGNTALYIYIGDIVKNPDLKPTHV